MSDDTKSDFDPRFDPAFQRGFDTSIPVAEYVPQLPPRRRAEPAPAPIIPPPAAPPEAETPVEPVVAQEEEDEQQANVVEESNLARNPFLLLLGIVAVVLVAAGIWLFVQSGDAFNSSEVQSQGDYMSLDAIIHSAPFISLLGGATAIGVLFLFAVKWRKRR